MELEGMTGTVPPGWSEADLIVYLNRRHGAFMPFIWEKYRDDCMMADYEEEVSDVGSIARSRYALYNLGLPFEVSVRLSYFQWQQHWDAASTMSWETPRLVFFPDGSIETYSYATFRGAVINMALYIVRMTEHHATIMKINQIGTGGRGGLMSSYPH